jgi:hypothetical protein
LEEGLISIRHCLQISLTNPFLDATPRQANSTFPASNADANSSYQCKSRHKRQGEGTSTVGYLFAYKETGIAEEEKKKFAPGFEKLRLTTRMASQVQKSSIATPTTASVPGLEAYALSQSAQQQLGDQYTEQTIENSRPDILSDRLTAYAVPESTDLNEVKDPIDWLDTHHFDPFDTLPSKATQDFVTTCNLYCKCMVGFWFPVMRKDILTLLGNA